MLIDDKDITKVYGSFGARLDPRQSDGQHLIEGELRFRYLPPGRYLVKVKVFKGPDIKHDAKDQYLYIQE